MAIASALQVTEILSSTLSALKRQLIPLDAFSVAFNKDQSNLRRGKVMEVPYYPLVTQASRDFTGTYQFDDAVVQAKEVTINKRKYQSVKFTSEDFSRYNWEPAKYGEQLGNKLAFDVITDVLSVVTLANFGAAVVTAAAADFDVADVDAIKTVADNANWPIDNRSMILAWAYYNHLLADSAIRPAYAYGNARPIQDGIVPEVTGFATYGSAGIPANGQNLVGMALHKSAIIVGFSPIPPAPAVRQQLVSYEAVSDPESGLTLEHRVWGDPDTDSHKEVLEVNYGYAVGETAALKRIVSA